MFAAQGNPQDLSSLVPIVLVAITGMVIFWRTMIKVVVIGLILLMVLGFSYLLQNLH
jgi:hypothetical protein